MRSWGSGLSIGLGTRVRGVRFVLVRGSLAFAGAGSNCGLGSGDQLQAMTVGDAAAPFLGLGCLVLDAALQPNLTSQCLGAGLREFVD